MTIHDNLGSKLNVTKYEYLHVYVSTEFFNGKIFKFIISILIKDRKQFCQQFTIKGWIFFAFDSKLQMFLSQIHIFVRMNKNVYVHINKCLLWYNYTTICFGNISQIYKRIHKDLPLIEKNVLNGFTHTFQLYLCGKTFECLMLKMHLTISSVCLGSYVATHEDQGTGSKFYYLSPWTWDISRFSSPEPKVQASFSDQNLSAACCRHRRYCPWGNVKFWHKIITKSILLEKLYHD